MTAGWGQARLADVCIKTQTVDPKKLPDAEFDYVDVSGVSNRTFRIEATNRLFGSEAPSRARRRIEAGDVLFATVRPTLMRVARVPDELDGQVCSTGYVVLRPGPKLNASFLFYSMFRSEFMEEVGRLQKGASYPAVTDRQVLQQTIPLPTLEEQQRIVAILDQAFAALDRAHVNAEANVDDAELLFGNTLRASLSMHVDWPMKFLPEISENLDRQRIPITRKDREPGSVPYYGASGVVDYVADHIFDEDLLLVSEDGANLLARTYPIAFSISGKSWVNNHAHVLRFNDPTSQEYVRLYLNSISLEPYVSGMAQPKLNQSSLNKIPIPLPDEDERAAIVAKAADMRQQCETLAQRYSEQFDDIATLRQSLLQQAFSGQLT